MRSKHGLKIIYFVLVISYLIASIDIHSCKIERRWETKEEKRNKDQVQKGSTSAMSLISCIFLRWRPEQEQLCSNFFLLDGLIKTTFQVNQNAQHPIHTRNFEMVVNSLIRWHLTFHFHVEKFLFPFPHVYMYFSSLSTFKALLPYANFSKTNWKLLLVVSLLVALKIRDEKGSSVTCLFMGCCFSAKVKAESPPHNNGNLVVVLLFPSFIHPFPF